MFARETADPGTACREGAGSRGVLQTVQVGGRAEDGWDTLASITTVGGGGGGGGGGHHH